MNKSLITVLSILTTFAAAACSASPPDDTAARRAPLDGYGTPPEPESGGSTTGGDDKGGDEGGGCSGACGGSGSGSGGAGSGGSGSANGGGSATGSGTLDLSADIDVCGHVDAFTHAAGGGGGMLSIGGCDVLVDGATALVGEALLHVGGSACVRARLDASGTIDDGNVSANLLGSAHAKVCGKVHAYVAASGSAGGHVQVGAPDLKLAAGAEVTGSAAIALGASVCIEGSLNAHGELTACTVSPY